jgi:predicted ATPase/DNA-binding winged helix-turn-helix (wHTH) protein
MFVFGQFRLLPGQRSLLDGGSPVRIGSRALDLLTVLVERAGNVVGKDELMQRVWPHAVVDEAGLRVHIAALRKALGESRSGVRHITNVPLRGYCFVVPVQRQVLAPPQPSALAMPMAAAMTTVPQRLTRLIGRDEAVDAALSTLLRRRFVTLVGPGGMGKTSVALAVVERASSRYPQGLCFVDLASVADARLIVSTLASALGVPLRSADPLHDVITWLAGKPVLVVLDNCEHLVDAAAVLVERLLGGAPGLSVLATSREPLRARGEWVQRLTSLAAPPTSGDCSYAQALVYPAFELFVERAMASTDSLVFSDADVPLIAHLCRSLDGMPLAIELVAARLGVFGLRGLVTRLDDHLSLPTIGHRTAMPRHQGLRATLDWSHGLLTADEQHVLRRLSVFRERFSLDAAAAVALDASLDAGAVTHLVMNLVAKSLVSAEPGDDVVQYRLLQTTRSYAAERLAASGEQAEIERRHACYFRSLLDTITSDSEIQIAARWRERHGRKVDDLRAALRWALGDAGDAELGAALLAHSAALWFGLSMVNEYLQRLEQAIAALPAALVDGPLDMRLHLVLGQARLAMQGGAPEGLQALERAVALARRAGDTDTQVRGLWSIFALYSLRGEYEASRGAAELLGQVAHASGDAAAHFTFHRIMALCLHCLGDQAAALAHVQQALDPAARSQPGQGTLFHMDHSTAALTQLSRIRWMQGAPDEACRAANDAVDAARAADHPQSLAYALSYAACPVALWCGDHAAAQSFLVELQACVNDHVLVFWQSWPPLFRRALAAREGNAAAVAPDENTLHFSHVDMLATLHPGFVGAVATARVAQGLNRWCAPEILRVNAERRLLEDPADGEAAQRGLQAALTMALQQGAHGWALRCGTSLARLHVAAGRAELALEVLKSVQAPIVGGAGSRDVSEARELADEIEARLAATGPSAPRQRGDAARRASH